MFKSSYQVAKVWGIPIKVHLTLILLLLWISSDLPLPYSLFLAVGLLVSIVLHELGHSYVAIKKGCHVRQITLMALGGAAQMQNLPRKPKDEALMAFAGPAVSIFLFMTLFPLGNILPLKTFFIFLNKPRNIVHLLGFINLMLAGFNLIPAFPMDGGRVLRALLTPKMGRLKATYIASRIGKFLCIIGGLFALTHKLWFAFAIAVYIYIVGSREYKMVQMQESASNHGFGTWSPFGNPWDDNTPDDDEVTISPPPYKKGPDAKTHIKKTNDNDFMSKFFGNS